MTLDTQIQALFHSVRRQAGTIPPPASLTHALNELAPLKGSLDVDATATIMRLFATSSVEMWLRAVHSFLISAALTDASPLWASVGGYYASHYAVRAIAHLLGYYSLHNKKYVVRLERSVCSFTKAKGADSREHIFYWRCVKQHALFHSNNLFTDNPTNVDVSDHEHRNFASYIDHLNRFPVFATLNLDELKRRIEFLSNIEISAYPIPDRNKYPDLASVQIVAYHRIVHFRGLLNSALGDSNRFWSVHRNPSWSQNILDFQLIPSGVMDKVGQRMI
jgi:hypothetical protein